MDGALGGNGARNQSDPPEGEVAMSRGGTSDAVRRSSDDQEPGEQDPRRAIYESLNERRLSRERELAEAQFSPPRSTSRQAWQ
jgi:hypothetical protein